MAKRTAPPPASAPFPLVYLDVDDEITSAAARIRAAESEGLALVLPYGSRLATSRINFRLLAREAAERGKRIEVVCADASARALAAAAGLTVHPSVAAFEGHHLGGNGTGANAGTGASAATEDTVATSSDGAAGPEATLAGADAAATTGPGVAAVPTGGLTIEDDAPTRVITVPRRKPARLPLVGPPRPPVRTSVAIGTGLAAIALIVAGGFLAVDLLPSATIVLAPRSEEIGPVDLIVEARTDVTAPDQATLVIPAQRITFQLAAAQTITPTGVKVVDTKATGDVTFSNFDTGGGVLIPAGTIVRTESRIEFKTRTELTLPRATYVFRTDPPRFELVPSTGSVGVEAVEPGEIGNVGNNTITDVPRAGKNLQVTNPEATSGGAHTETPEISQADVDTALLAIEDSLSADLGSQVDEGTGVPPGMTLFPGTEVVADPEYSTDPATLVGSTETEVQLDATAEGSILGVDPSPIQGLAEADLQARVREGWSIAPGSMVVDPGVPTFSGEVVTYPVSLTATQVHDVDRAALTEQILGLKVAEARAVLDDFGDVEVSVWPDWVTTIPKNAERIAFTLAEPRPAPSPTP